MNEWIIVGLCDIEKNGYYVFDQVDYAKVDNDSDVRKKVWQSERFTLYIKKA